MSWDRIRFNGENSDGCIFTVITGLSSFRGASAQMGEDVLRAFCEHIRKQPKDYPNYLRPDDTQDCPLLYSHYVFSGPLSGQGANQPDGYAQKFYKFLKAHPELGEVYGSEKAIENRKWHPGRYGNVYLWIPNQKGVDQWWLDHRPKQAEVPKATAEVKPAARRRPNAPPVEMKVANAVIKAIEGDKVNV